MSERLTTANEYVLATAGLSPAEQDKVRNVAAVADRYARMRGARFLLDASKLSMFAGRQAPDPGLEKTDG